MEENNVLETKEVEQVVEQPKQYITPLSKIQNLVDEQTAALLPFFNGKEARYQKFKAAFAFAVTEQGLYNCDRVSIIKAFKKCCELDLEPGNGLGKVYLIKYGNAVNAQIGYKGYLELANRSPDVSCIYNHIVYEGDEFKVKLGTSTDIHHVPLNKSRDLVCTYAVVKFKNGDCVVEIAYKQDIEESRALSKSSNSSSSPWKLHYNSMAKIVPLRKILPNLGISVTVDDEFISADEAAYALKVVRQQEKEVKEVA